MCPLLFLVAVTAQPYEGGGRILLGDYTGGGAVILGPIRRQCVGVWISAGLSFNIHIYLVICILNSDLHKIRLSPASWGISALLLVLNN